MPTLSPISADELQDSSTRMRHMPRNLVCWTIAVLITFSGLQIDSRSAVQAQEATEAQERIFQVQNLEEFKQTLSELREIRSMGVREPVTIELGSGIYTLRETVKLTPAIVGRGLKIKAEKPGEVTLSGATELTPIEHSQPGEWAYQLPVGWDHAGVPRVISIEGELRSAARFPDSGYLRIEQALEDRRSGFIYQAEDLPQELDLADGVCDLILLHDWSSSRLPIASLDHQSRTLRTLGPIGCEANHYAIDHFEKQPRYWLEGHPAFARQPGEWYINRQQSLLVLKRNPDAADATAPVVSLPMLTTLLIATGTEESPLRGLQLQGLKFTGSSFQMPAGGLAGAQATMHEPRDANGKRSTHNRPMLPAAVVIELAENIQVTNCRFTGLGGSGFWLGGRTKNCRIQRCHFEDLGGNGLNLGEDNSRQVDGRTWYQSAPEQVPTETFVSHCRINRCGQVLPGAVAIWAPLNLRLKIVENTIHDCPYTGISLGWIWNETPSPAAENLIQGNRIEYVMQVLSDGGGIYTLGHQPGSVIEKNHISDIPINLGRAESNGMFLDEGTSGFTIQQNTIRRTDRSPLRFHRAGKNVVRDNSWELAAPQIPAVRYNNTPEANITLENNQAVEPQKRYYLIGNSLTWDTRPSALDEDVHWHVDCGKNLSYIYRNPNSPCVASSRIWPRALTTAKYDYLSLQPHYGSTLEQDLEIMSKWIESQESAIIVVHTGWARQASFQDELSESDISGPLTHCPAYFSALIDQLQERYPERLIRSTKAIDLLAAIAQDIEAKQAPFENIVDLYRDSIHMKNDSGRYLMHNAMRHAFDQPRSDRGFNDLKPEIQKYLDQILDRVLGPFPE